MTPITPNGVEIREMSRPLGLDQLSKFLPIGSSKDAMSLKVIAIPLIRSSSNLSLSMKDSDRPLLRALSISFLLASRIACLLLIILSAIASIALFFCLDEILESNKEAPFACLPIFIIFFFKSLILFFCKKESCLGVSFSKTFYRVIF